ncbi:hypothetical protein EVAR_5469_1 [Eumeta japonica]|uniref:Uncharacterized protein n=1 Tax=Eumeta variegata TaxID=151549 RepID=A0A4C1TC52_EUMVA|nr:hypothetical protein EVAR_5469_1 [Eumeta japonica]
MFGGDIRGRLRRDDTEVSGGCARAGRTLSRSRAASHSGEYTLDIPNRTIWQSPWVNGVCAVMAGTSDKYFTMQGSGNPVSAAGQGEKAGPQASSSSDCSSSVVGNLATGESVKPQKTVIDDETEALEEMEVEKKKCQWRKKMKKKEEEEEILGDENPKDKDFMPDKKTKDPETFSREELNDLIRDLNLPKDGAELLASRLKHKNLLAPKVTAYFYRNREEEFRKFFTKDDENSVVYCSNVKGLVDELKPDTYRDDEWRLFIDSSTRSLKAVLLHISNTLAPIPIAHSTKLKETYENLEIVLDKIQYSEHQWRICGDLKIATLLLGQQSGFTKYPCYLCLWDSRDRKNHYVKKEWPSRVQLNVGRHNVIRAPLIQPSNYLLPPLHIKLGLIKQYVKALDKDGDCFRYLRGKFPAISDAKLKEGIFNGPQIRTLFQDTNFSGKQRSVSFSQRMTHAGHVPRRRGGGSRRCRRILNRRFTRNAKLEAGYLQNHLHMIDRAGYCTENFGHTCSAPFLSPARLSLKLRPDAAGR